MKGSPTRALKKSGPTFRRPTTISTSRTSDCRQAARKLGRAAVLVLSLLTATEAVAQQRPIVDRVRFIGSEHFSAATLERRIRTTPNRLILGIRGFTWWVWLYRLGDQGHAGQRIGRALMASGEPPAWLDSSTIAADLEQLRSFFAQEGFREAEITARIDTTRSGKRASVSFEIDPGPATFFRRIRFEGLDSLDLALQKALVDESLLTPQTQSSGTPLDYRAVPLRYSEPLLVEERRRLLAALRDEGFAAITRDSITAFVTTYRPDSLDVVMHVRPGPRYLYGAIHFDVEGPLNEADPAGTVKIGGDSLVSYRMEPGIRISPGLLTHALRMRPGTPYNQSALQQTKQRLEATGIFSFTDIAPQPPTGAALPHLITVRTRPRHQFGMQTFVLQSSGVLGGVGSELGAGLSLSYENVNLIGSGELLRISSTASVAADVDSTVFSSSQGEVSASLALPYLVAPFHDLEDRLGLNQARTRFTVTLLTARREDLRLLLRGRGTARIRLEMRHSPTVTSFVDLLDVSLSNPDTLRGFKYRFLDRILGADDSLIVSDPVQRAQVLEDYTHPQINNAIRYTFRGERVNPLRRDQGFSYEAAIELGGNLPYLLDRYVYSAGRVEGSLPGLPFFRGSGSRDRMNYRQYIRLVADFRQYFRVGSSNVLALKAVGGWAQPIGQADNVPFFRRFFSGGASSVRGWHLRQLGPGATNFSTGAAADADATNILGGDIKLEFSAELRHTLLDHTLGAEWIVAAFGDAGNVWFGPRNPGFANLAPHAPDGRFALNSFVSEMGVGTGMGLRLSWAYLIARFDVAYRAWDPARPEAGWWPTGLREPAAYFRFGHAF